MRKSWIVMMALVASAAVVACLGDRAAPAVPGADAGAGDDASRSALDASESADAPVDAPRTDASDGATSLQALFVGTNFQSAELSVVDLGARAVLGRSLLDDQDSVPIVSGGLGFVVQRAIGKIAVLDPARPWTTRATIDVNDGPDAGAYASNPRTVLVTTGTTAYVARFASNVVKVVDIGAAAVTGDVSLGSFVAPGDPDGLVDVEDGAFDPATGRAYFLLQRIDQFDFSGTAPDFVGKCITGRGMLVALDTATNTFVDLNGAAAGLGIELAGANPGSLAMDFAARRAIVVDTGCYMPVDGGADAGPAARAGRGIEAIDLANGTTSWLYRTTELPRLAGLVWIDAARAFVGKGGKWYAWAPAASALGDEAIGFPQAPFYDGADRVVGLRAKLPDAGSDAGTAWSVIAWRITTGEITELLRDPFHGVTPSAAFGVGSAKLH